MSGAAYDDRSVRETSDTEGTNRSRAEVAKKAMKRKIKYKASCERLQKFKI